MAIQNINRGTTPNDGQGDTARAGALKINENFAYLLNAQAKFKAILGPEITSETLETDVVEAINTGSPFTLAFANLAFIKYFEIVDGDIKNIYFFKLVNIGGGNKTFGTNGSVTLTENNLFLTGQKLKSVQDFQELNSTVTEDFGDIGTTSLIDYVNGISPAITIQATSIGATILKAIVNNTAESYLFKGDAGDYGQGELQLVDDDLEALSETSQVSVIIDNTINVFSFNPVSNNTLALRFVEIIDLIEAVDSENGLSAFEVWLADGNDFSSLADYYAFIKGEKGDTGEAGPQGDTGPQGPPGTGGEIYNWSVYDGTSFSVLTNPVTLQNTGDYIEFTVNPKEFGSGGGTPLGLGIFGEVGLQSSTIGFIDTSQTPSNEALFYIRDTNGEWLTLEGFNDLTKENEEITVRIEWFDTVIKTYKNGVFQKDIIKGIVDIRNIGNAYDTQSGKFFTGWLKDIEINSNSGLISIETPATATGILTNTNVDLLQSENNDTTKNYPNNFYEYDPTGYNGNPIFTVYSKINDYGYYAKFDIINYKDLSSGIYADLYRIANGQLYKYSENNVMVSQNLSLLENGESECTYKIEGSSDFIGGFHGDETIISVDFYQSGLKINDLSSVITITPCESFYYAQKSNMHQVDDPDHTIQAIHDKITKITNGGYTTFNRLIWQESVNVIKYYHGISSISKNAATEVHNDYIESHVFTGNNNEDNLERIGAREYYGHNNINNLSSFATSKLIRPSTEDEGCDMFVWDRSQDSKYYRTFRPIANTQINDIWESFMEVFYRVN
jgi:hypothetical protein